MTRAEVLTDAEYDFICDESWKGGAAGWRAAIEYVLTERIAAALAAQPAATERAGDADDVAWVMPRADARDLLGWLRHNRPLGMPDATFDGLTDALAAQPAAVPDPAEATREAVEALLPSEPRPLHDETWPLISAYAMGRWDFAQRVRAVLGDPSGALAERDAKVRADELRQAVDNVLRGAPVGNESYSARQVADYLEARARRADRLAADAGSTP